MTERWPAMIHAGGNVCGHRGQLRAAIDDEGGPACPGGERVTHAWISGRKVPIAEGWPVLARAYGWTGRTVA